MVQYFILQPHPRPQAFLAYLLTGVAKKITELACLSFTFSFCPSHFLAEGGLMSHEMATIEQRLG